LEVTTGSLEEMRKLKSRLELRKAEVKHYETPPVYESAVAKMIPTHHKDYPNKEDFSERHTLD
jgi:hypothetical protein